MGQIKLSYKNLSAFCKPIWGPFLLTSLFFLILMGLGTWQVQRLCWKEGILINAQKIWGSSCLEGESAQNLLREIVAAQKILSPANDRCLILKGEFIFSTNLFLQSKMFSQKNKNVRKTLEKKNLSLYGVDVMTIFKTEGGEYLWVNRGWAPLYKKKPIVESLQRNKSISLYLKTPPKVSIFSSLMPKNIPSAKIWYTPDLQTMSTIFEVQAIPFFYGVQISKKDSASQEIDFPIPQLEMFTMQNNHLTYAFIWYSLAACSFLIYGIYHRRQRLREREQAHSLN